MWKNYLLVLVIWEHIKTVHEGCKDFKCKPCATVHEGDKDLKYEFSDNSFSEEGTLEKHIHKVHEARKDHKCKYWDNFFSEGGKLKKHIQKVHDNERINVAKQQNIIYTYMVNNYDWFKETWAKPNSS